MKHQDVTLKRPIQVSLELEEQTLPGKAIIQFDGGTSQGLGTGGFLVWNHYGKLLSAQALWFGEKHKTNNESELASLTTALEWTVDQITDE